MILLLALSVNVFAQETVEPIRGTNFVLLSSDSSAEYCFKKAVTLIAQKGFPVEFADKELGIVTTGFKNLSKNLTGVHMKMSLSVNVVGGKTEVRLSGSYYMTGFENMVDPVAFGIGMKNSPKMITFDMLANVAKELNAGQVSYLKE